MCRALASENRFAAAPVLAGKYCSACGVCSAMCPCSAIEMGILDGELQPLFDEEKCEACGLCVTVCPVLNWQTPIQTCGQGERDPFLGAYRGTYAGWSSDSRVRNEGASGGVVTGLLIYMLREQLVSGALVITQDHINPLIPKAAIVRTEREAISAAGSKYCPVMLDSAIREILISDREEQFVVVGLPCHIRGLRLAAAANEQLSKKLKWYIGLFCSHTVTFSGTNVLLQKLHVKKEHVRSLRYRGDGWPGTLKVVARNHTEFCKTMPYFQYWPSLFTPYYFTPLSCMFCPDMMNELADISCGDAWLSEIKAKDQIGTSILISRTMEADLMLRNAVDRGFLNLTPMAPDLVAHSQHSALVFKKLTLPYRVSVYRRFRHLPLADLGEPCNERPKILLYLTACLQLVENSLGSKRVVRCLLRGIPWTVLRWAGYALTGLELLVWKVNQWRINTPTK